MNETVPEPVPKRADQLVVGDRIAHKHLPSTYATGPGQVVYVNSHTYRDHASVFVAYVHEDGYYDSTAYLPDGLIGVYPADDPEITQPIGERPLVREGGVWAVPVAGGLIEVDPPEDSVCPVCRSRYSKHNALGLRLHGLAPVNEYDESLDALAPCQPIGCDNGHHVPGCFYAKADD